MSTTARRRPALFVAAVMLAGVAIVVPAPAAVADDGRCHALVSCGGGGDTPGTPGGGGGGGGGGPVSDFWSVRPGNANDESKARMQLVYGRTWDFCWVAEPARSGYTYTEALAEIDRIFSGGGDPPCPYLGPVDPTPSIVFRWEEIIDLPVPTPEIKPGKAVTGLAAYLETDFDDNVVTVPVTNPFGPAIVVTATAEFHVDWGDGSPIQVTRRVGVPYSERDGEREITHVYPRSGDMQVAVETHWRGTWQIEGGPVEEFTTVRVEAVPPIDVPVEELQAVRSR